MGLSKIIATIGILVIAGVVVTAFIPSAFDGLNQWLGEVYNASFFLIEPRQGEAICDLIIRTNVNVIQEEIPLTPSEVVPTEFYVNPANPYSFTYERCTFHSEFVIFNLIDNGVGQAPRPQGEFIENFQTNKFVNLLGSTFVQELRLTDASDPTQRVDWILNPNLSYTTSIPPSLTQETPLSLDATFVVPNLPVRTYNLELFLTGAEQGVNGQPVGQPFRGQICNQFQTFSAGQCVSP